MFFLALAAIFLVLVVLSLILKYFLVSKTETINFDNSHVLITGGSSGIGRALARRVFVMGARVTLVARQQDKLQQAKRWILNSCDSKKEHLIQCIPLDITAAYPIVQQAIQSAEDVFGGVDVLVNSAGYSYPCVFQELGVEDFESMMRVNYMGSVQVTKATIKSMVEKFSRMGGGRMDGKGMSEERSKDREMKEGGLKEGGNEIIERKNRLKEGDKSDGVNEGLKRMNEEKERMNEGNTEKKDGKKRMNDGMKRMSNGEGRVVFVSSQAGQMGLYGFSAYSASKFALRGLAESLQMELLPSSIKVCVAYPPDTRTPGYEEEMRSKPLETKLISDSSGLFEAEYVADKMLAGVMRGDFSIHMGLEGTFMNHLTAGMSPVASAMDAVVQVLFGGLLRLVGLVYVKKFEGIVFKCQQQKQQQLEQQKTGGSEESKKK